MLRGWCGYFDQGPVITIYHLIHRSRRPNFVASSQEKIEAAKEQWRKGDWGHGLFDLPTGDRDEFIPLPP
jgi:hypothetical protein